ncbi:hypothetical protein C8R46DRAFT_1214152 [Mycena filopes]|nr:hypothetical protein C8R46DRAFT_1214152 [Mycena filopes]
MSYGPYGYAWPTTPGSAWPTTPAPTPSRPNAAYEAQFPTGIFDEVLNVPAKIAGATPKRRTRARFCWPEEATPEDRFLVAFRCMQQAGFETIGDFFAAALDKHSVHQPVYQSVTAFLQCKGVDSRTHPISIVDRIFRDPRSKKRSDADEIIKFGLPRYALPPSQRLSAALPELAKNNTHNALINWALPVIVDRWKDEADLLLQPSFGFVHEPPHDEPADKFSWTEVLNWSMTSNQELIALNAPVMFTCLTGVAVNDRAQGKLDAAAAAVAAEKVAAAQAEAVSPSASAPAAPAPGRELDSDDTDNEDDDAPPLDNGVPPNMRRDPWLVRNNFPLLLSS